MPKGQRRVKGQKSAKGGREGANRRTITMWDIRNFASKIFSSDEGTKMEHSKSLLTGKKIKDAFKNNILIKEQSAAYSSEAQHKPSSQNLENTTDNSNEQPLIRRKVR